MTQFLGFVALFLTIAVLAVVFLGRRYRRLFTLTTQADSVHFARASAGHTVALHRYRPQQARTGERPVVLCHGLAANRFNLDFDEKYSFARYLRARGYDVFVVELRAAGHYSFDDLVLQDVPAILDEIKAVTGADKVNWVGHSLGGLIAYAAMAGPVHDRIAAIATLGSPASFAPHKWLRRVAWAYFLTRRQPQALAPMLARLYAPLSVVPLPGTSLFINRANTERAVLERALWNMVSAASPGVLDQMVTAVRRGTPVTLSTQADPDAHLKAIDQPVLLIAGKNDWLAPPASVRHAFYNVRSEDKELIVLSKDNGYSADYGHGDLILGKNAPNEVFPIVERFLWKHRRAGAQPSLRIA